MSARDEQLVVYGTMMRGLCDEPKLVALGGVFEEAVSTAPEYRMWSMGDGSFAAVCRVRAGGVSLVMERWSFTREGISELFLRYSRPGFCFGWIELVGDARARAILAERYLVEQPNARDISARGGWRAFLERSASPQMTER